MQIIIPYRNGQDTILELLDSIPRNIGVTIVDDLSTVPLPSFSKYKNVSVVKSEERGYFTGAVNFGISTTNDDVLILNQDIYFTDESWLTQLNNAIELGYGYIGERISGNNPAWPNGYIHGTYMYISREVINKVGLLNAELFPMWGSTAEYQLRVARAGFKVLPLEKIDGFYHHREDKPFGESFRELLNEEGRKNYTIVPPLVSVVIVTYNYSQNLKDTIASLIGGDSDIGYREPQTFQAFEIIIVDDGSTDDTPEILDELCDDWKGIRRFRVNRQPKNPNGKYVGKPSALNYGIKNTFGKYILPLDADDMMEPDRIERMFDAIRDDETRVVYDGAKPFLLNWNGGEIKDPFMAGLVTRYNVDLSKHPEKHLTLSWYPADYDFDVLINKNFMHNSIMFAKSAWETVGGYPEEFQLGREDWAMNVRLGSEGFCGYPLKEYCGLLYRRNENNRTNVNGTPDWMAMFQKQMREFFSDIYRGNRKLACCGRGNVRSTRTEAFAPAPLGGTGGGGAEQIPNVGENTTLLIYTGSRGNGQSWSEFGAITNTMYRVTAGKPFAVDNRDLSTDSQRYRGFLQMYEAGGKQKYGIYARNIPPAPEPAPVIEEVIVEDDGGGMSSELMELTDSYRDLLSALNNNTYSESELTALLAYEQAHKNRISIIDKIEKLLDGTN